MSANLSNYDKAAVFLLTVGEELAAEILKFLDVKTIGKITASMTKLHNLSNEETNKIIEDIWQKIGEGNVVIGGSDFVKRVLSKTLGDEYAERVMEMASVESAVDSLRFVDTKTLTNFLMNEHPQTISLVLCLLDPPQAAAVLASLPDNLKADVTLRIAKIERIPESAIEELNEVLAGQIDVGKGKKIGGTKMVAEILNNIDRTVEENILAKVEEEDGKLAESIRQLMFLFDDLVNLDDKGIQTLLKEVSNDDLVLALKTASEELKTKIFKNMSQRAAQILKEEMEVRGAVRVSDVEKAQQNIVKVARKLEQEGKIVLAGKGGEQFVS